MQSHIYQFRWRDLLRSSGGPMLAVLAGLAVLLHLGQRWALLPPPPIAWDPETLVLRHQSRACRSAPPAEILLVGDSTCLVGVDAAELSRRLPGRPRVLNLALFRWLGLDTYGTEVRDFAASHPGRVHMVVLLVSSAKLTEAGRFARTWEQIHNPECQRDRDVHCDWLGARLVRENLLSYLLATPLHGGGADFYGFASEIDAYMSAHNGSVLSSGSFVPPREHPPDVLPAFPLAPALETETRAFRAMMPAGAKLFVGLTPYTTASKRSAERARSTDLLRRWNAWLSADTLLTNLPATLPNCYFGPGTHLNEIGQRRFTAILARELTRQLAANPSGPEPTTQQ